MKKSAFPAALLLIAAGLSGCPIYDRSSSGCFDDWDCAPGYACNDRSGSCEAERAGSDCAEPDDCGPNETCSRFGTCTIGDCNYTSVGCVAGFACSIEDGRWLCVPEAAAQGGSDGGAGASTDGGAGATSGGAPGGGAPSTSPGGSPGDAGASTAGAAGSG